MLQSDWNYLCKMLCNSISTSVRIYKEHELQYIETIYTYDPDPFLRYKEEVLNIKKDIGIFETPLHQLYGYINVGGNMKIIIGPTGFIVKDDKKLAQLMFELDVKKENQDCYIGALCSAPTITVEKFAATLAFIMFLITGAKNEINEISELKTAEARQILEEAMNQHTTVQITPAVEKEIIAGHNNERNIVNLIQNGQVEALTALLFTPTNMKPGKMSQTALRQIKNALICASAVASRAAIQGGLDPVTSFSLSDLYIQRCEILNDYNTISSLINELMIDYAKRVKNLKYGVNRPSKFLLKCSQYVALNLTKNIKADEMAAELKLNRTYLCSQFKLQSGISLTEYFLREKILEAERLLSQTELPLSEISDYLAFSSQSHFQNVFKKINGNTPKSFRDKV